MGSLVAQHTASLTTRGSIWGLVTRSSIYGQQLWCAIETCHFTHPLIGYLQLKGDEYASLEKPPSHRLFDTPVISPVLKQRKAAQEAKDAVAAAESTSSNTGLNVSILELAALLRPPPAAAPPYPYMQPQPIPATNTAPSPMLLPSSRAIGQYLTLQDFCTQYDITDTVRNKLSDEGYTNSRVLQYIAIEELKEVGFKNGEIASLKDAVIRWSVPML